MRDRVNVRWLVSLRWLELACAALLVLAVDALTRAVPVARLLALVAVGAGVNAWLDRRARREPPPGEGVVAGVLLLDVLLLTVMLAISGAIHNPFAALYLFEAMVAALVLRPVLVAGLSVVTALAYGSLYFLPAEHVHDPNQMQRHLVGMWVAYAVAAPFVAVAIHRLREALAGADRDVEAARARAERTERLASLATLAAGAAHEIANPLATIAVVAGELARSADPRVVEDADLVRREVQRCREVLDQLAAGVGAATGEPPVRTPIARVLAEIASRPDGVVDAIEGERPEVELIVPVGLLGQAVRRLVANAREAGAVRVVLRLDRVGADLRLAVVDDGPGMDPATLARASEPFFTTTPRGMGLGLFFARSVVEHVGGRLEVRSEVGRGTEAALLLPVAP
jgi:two-component system sensor histidine kinase RegB